MGSALRYTLAPKADLGVFYEADMLRYANTTTAHILTVVSKDVFVTFYKDCASLGFQFDGQPVGGVLFDGQHAHIAVLPEHHGRWALLLKPACEWLFALKQEVLVEVEIENRTCIRFMERNRWQLLEVVGDKAIYRMTSQGGDRKTAHAWFGRISCGESSPIGHRSKDVANQLAGSTAGLDLLRD